MIHRLSGDGNRVLEYLEQETRFQRKTCNYAFLTKHLLNALELGQIDNQIISLDSNPWLKIELLSEGGQGRVMIACPLRATAQSGDLVAIKQTKPNTHNRDIKQLQHEIQILSRVGTHPNIASLVDSDEGNGIFATRLVDGPSLQERLSQDRRFSVASVVSVGIDLCHALTHLHALGFIHKDIKPDNVIYEGGIRAVLIDLGLAVHSQEDSGGPGTPYYIAPEILLRKPADARSDVFSLSATLFHLLAGHPPHYHKCLDLDRYQSKQAHLDYERFVKVNSAIDCDINDFRQDVPRLLSRLLRKSLSTQPSDRPSSVTFFQEQLEQLLSTFNRSRNIEEQLWRLGYVLLQAYRSVQTEPEHTNKEWQLAESILLNLENIPKMSEHLGRLIEHEADYAGFPCDPRIIDRTSRIATRLNTIIGQLKNYLDEHTPIQRGPHATIMLVELVGNMMENVRLMSMESVSCAHEWRSFLFQLGLDPHSRAIPTEVSLSPTKSPP